MSYQVFISYSSIKDLDGTIADFHANLENAVQQRVDSEVKIYYDKQSIHAADDWQGNLSTALDECKVLLVLLSPSWLHREWCLNEYEYFMQSSKQDNPKKVIPVKWIDTNPDDAGDNNQKQKIIRELNGIQQVDWTDMKYDRNYKQSKQLRQAIGELADNIVRCLKGHGYSEKPQERPQEESQERSQEESQERPPKQHYKKWVYIIVAAALVSIIIWFFTKPPEVYLTPNELDVIDENIAYFERVGNRPDAEKDSLLLTDAYKKFGNGDDWKLIYIVRSNLKSNEWLLVMDLGAGPCTKDSVNAAIDTLRKTFSKTREQTDNLGKWFNSAYAELYDLKRFEKINGKVINVNKDDVTGKIKK